MKTRQREKNIVAAVLAVAGVVWLLSLAPAGDLEPPSAPGPTMHTLDEVYNLHAPAPGFETSVDRGTTHIFMKVDGVVGESTDDVHRDWCNVISFKQAHAMTVGTSSGGTRYQSVVFEDVLVVKPIDKASPKFAEAVCRGTVFAKVEIDVTGSYDGSGPVKYYYGYELRNVVITGYIIGASGQNEDLLTEEVTFAFETIRVKYTETDDAGSFKGNVEYQYDIEEGV